MRAWLLTFVVWLLLGLNAWSYQSPGSPDGFLNDFAKVLTPEQEEYLENSLTGFAEQYGHQIAVVVVPDLAGESIETYANRLFREWGIGQKGSDNGVLFLVSVTPRQARIEVGYGLEGALTDLQSNDILRSVQEPLKYGSYNDALRYGVRQIQELIENEPVKKNTSSSQWQGVKGSYQQFLTYSRNNPFKMLWVYLLFFLLMVICLLAPTSAWWAGSIAGLAVGSWYYATTQHTSIKFIFITIILGLGIDFYLSSHPRIRQFFDQLQIWGAGLVGFALGAAAAFITDYWPLLPLFSGLGMGFYALGHAKKFWMWLAKWSLLTLVFGFFARALGLVGGGSGGGSVKGFGGGSSGGGGSSSKL